MKGAFRNNKFHWDDQSLCQNHDPKTQEQAEWDFPILKENFLATSPNVRQD